MWYIHKVNKKFFLDENEEKSVEEFDTFEEAQDVLFKKMGLLTFAEQQVKAVKESENRIKERYDRLMRNGWNETDAFVESGLHRAEEKK